MIETFSYTGARVAAEVRAKFGDLDSVRITDDDLLVWVNNGQRAVSQGMTFIEKVSTTNLLAGKAVYDLAALFGTQRMQAISSIVANGGVLDVLQWGQFQERHLASTDTTEIPTACALYGSNLTVWPIPSKTVANGLVLYYTAFPADIVALADTLTVPDRLYTPLVDFVHAQALELDDNFEASQLKLAQHQQGVMREFEKERVSPSDYYPFVTTDDSDNIYFGRV